jgi:hypothetical protein
MQKFIAFVAAVASLALVFFVAHQHFTVLSFPTGKVLDSDAANAGALSGHTSTLAQAPNLLLIDGNAKVATGHWTDVNGTQAILDGTAKTLTFAGNKITWQDGTVWYDKSAVTHTIQLAGNSPPVTLSDDHPGDWTFYHNQKGMTTSVIRTGTNRLYFIDALGRISAGSMMNGTQASVDLYPGDAATMTDNSVTWQDGSIWTKDSNSVISVIDYTNTKGLPTHIIRDSANHMMFIDSLNRWSFAHFLNATDVSVDLYPGDTATINANGIAWHDGTTWTLVPPSTMDATPNTAHVQSLLDQSYSWVHVIRFSDYNSNTVILIDALGHMMPATIIQDPSNFGRNLQQAKLNANPNITVQFTADGGVRWSTGAVWFKATGAVPPADTSVHAPLISDKPGSYVHIIWENQYLPQPPQGNIPPLSASATQCSVASQNMIFLNVSGFTAHQNDNGYVQPQGSIDMNDPAVIAAHAQALAGAQQNCISLWPHASHADACKKADPLCVGDVPTGGSSNSAPGIFFAKTSEGPPYMMTAVMGKVIRDWPGGPFNGVIAFPVSGSCQVAETCKTVSQ